MRVLLTLAALLAPTLALAAAGDRDAAMLSHPTGIVAWLAVLPLALPLTGAAVTLALRAYPFLQRYLAAVVLSLTAACAVSLAIMVGEHGTIVTMAGNWLPPFGIAIAVDPLGALFVTTTAVLGLAGLAFACGDAEPEDVEHGFYSFYLLLIAGVCGAFSTGDVFNLYVWFEVFLVASFGLMIVGGRPLQLDGAVKYGVLNLIATTIFLIAVTALYGVTGTLNMADLRTVLAGAPPGPLATIGALFVMAFAMKAAAMPLHMWLPASYHVPRTIAAALFAGLLTKIGVYALIRVVIMLYGGAGAVFVAILFWVGVATAVLGALAAIAQADLKRMSAFLVVSGIGVMLIGLGLGAGGLTGTLVYAVHSMIAMTGLFFAVGYAERLCGSCDLHSATNLYAVRPLAAALFLVFGFASAGLPPFSGFWPKVMLLQAALGAGGTNGVIGAVAIVLSGFFTTVAAGRVWALVYLRSGGAVTPRAAPSGLVVGTVLLAALVVLLGIVPEPLIEAATAATAGVLAPDGYVGTVLGEH